MTRSLFIAAVLAFLIGDTATAADDTADWSKYTKHGTLKGVVVSADGDKITLQVPKVENKARPGTKRPSLKPGHEDVDVPFAKQGLVRWEKMPYKPDGSKPSTKEMEELRKPTGAPGYAAAKGDLKAGHIVELTLVRPSNIAADKVKETDIVIKWAVIQGETQPPKKDEPKKKN